MTTPEQRRQRIGELVGEGITVPLAVYAAIDQDRPPADLLRSWHWSSYLWDRPAAKAYAGIENALAGDQAQWDTNRAIVKGQLELRAERKAREAAEEKQRAERAEAYRVSQADQVKAELRARYLALPGVSEQDFEREYPTLLADHRRREMDRLESEGKRAVANVIRTSF